MTEQQRAPDGTHRDPGPRVRAIQDEHAALKRLEKAAADLAAAWADVVAARERIGVER